MSEGYSLPTAIAVALSTNRAAILRLHKEPLSEAEQKDVLRLLADLLDDRQSLINEAQTLRNQVTQALKQLENLEKRVVNILDHACGRKVEEDVS